MDKLSCDELGELVQFLVKDDFNSLIQILDKRHDPIYLDWKRLRTMQDNFAPLFNIKKNKILKYIDRVVENCKNSHFPDGFGIYEWDIWQQNSDNLVVNIDQDVEDYLVSKYLLWKKRDILDDLWDYLSKLAGECETIDNSLVYHMTMKVVRKCEIEK